MLLNILLGIAAVVVLLLFFIATRPGSFAVERVTTIGAAPAVVYPQVNTLRCWEAWSPWHKRDPNMTLTYAGPESGVGASYSWAGNKEVGEGRLTIEESRANELVRVKLEFLKPFAATNPAEFRFTPDGGGTRVTWTMNGTHSFISKAMGLVVSMDKMIGGDFEKGLANMKAVAEGKG